MMRPPAEAQPALAAIHAAGGDELVQAMLAAFHGFATAQAAWLERQVKMRAFDDLALAARALRISATQVGALSVAKACERIELAGAGRDASAVDAAMEDVHDALAAARPWLDAHADE